MERPPSPIGNQHCGDGQRRMIGLARPAEPPRRDVGIGKRGPNTYYRNRNQDRDQTALPVNLAYSQTAWTIISDGKRWRSNEIFCI